MTTNSHTDSPGRWGFFFMYEGNMTGGPKRSFDTAVAARKYGLHPILISNQPSPITEKAAALGIGNRIIDVPKSCWQRQGRALSVNPLKMIQIRRDLGKVSSQIENVIRSETLQGIWCRGIKNVLMSRRAAKRTKIPLVWDIGAEYKSKGLVTFIHWLGFAASTKVVAQGRHVLKDTFPEWLLNRYRQKIAAIIPGLDQSRIEKLKPLAQQYCRSAPISIIGTVNRRKNQLSLIQACLQISNSTKFKLRLVGSTADEDYYRECQELTKQFDERFEWFGWSDNVADVLKDSSALVVCSKQEGLPQVVLEAMYAGRPVVSVPVGGVPDLVDHLKTGFMAKSHSLESIREVLVSFLESSDEQIDSIRLAGQQTVQQRASHDNWESTYATLLQDLPQSNGNFR